MERSEIKSIVESILLASDDPVTAERLAQTLQNGMSQSAYKEILDELKEDYENRSFQIIEVAEGYLLCTRKDFSDWIKKYFRIDKSSKLSQPALDTLSIVAYKQPITRAEVEEIRGVDSAGVIKTLLEKNVIGPAGRKKALGRPMMYKTTRKFLEYFGLKDLSDLPTLEDLKEADITGENLDAKNMQAKLIFEDSESINPSSSTNEAIENPEQTQETLSTEPSSTGPESEEAETKE